MCKEKLVEFTRITGKYEEFEYLLSVIMCNAGSTILKHKTSSLITFNNNNKKLNNIWKKYRKNIWNRLDINFFELKSDEKATVVLFYDKELLESSLRNERNLDFLKRFGYSANMRLQDFLILLRKRYYNHVCPHEIGVFLGYPVEDVIAFAECPNKKCKMVGYWKVYHDVEEARRTFEKYDKIKYGFMESMMKGIKPTELDFEELNDMVV